MAHDYGATGPVLRGSGIDWDLRKKRPYGNYDKFDFNVITVRDLKVSLVIVGIVIMLE